MRWAGGGGSSTLVYLRVLSLGDHEGGALPLVRSPITPLANIHLLPFRVRDCVTAVPCLAAARAAQSSPLRAAVGALVAALFCFLASFLGVFHRGYGRERRRTLWFDCGGVCWSPPPTLGTPPPAAGPPRPPALRWPPPKPLSPLCDPADLHRGGVGPSPTNLVLSRESLAGVRSGRTNERVAERVRRVQRKSEQKRGNVVG